MSLLQNKYKNEVRPALMEEFGLKNPFQVAQIKKVVVNMGLGEAVTFPSIYSLFSRWLPRSRSAMRLNGGSPSSLSSSRTDR